jgi:zinc protease
MSLRSMTGWLFPCVLLLGRLLFGPEPASAAEVRRVVLPNGVRLILKSETSAELVAVSICIRMEPDRSPVDDATGQMVARSLFSSSLNRSRENISASLSEVGGSVETLRTAEHVNITCVSLPSQIREAVYLLCEVLKNTDFDALERSRTEIVAEQRRGTASFSAGQDILRRSLQARPDVSELPFDRITHAQAATYFRSRYVAERTAIAVVGQFDAVSVETALRDSLADFDRHAVRPIRSEPLYSHATNFPIRRLRLLGVSGYALVATAAPPLSDTDYPAFVVLKSILGEGHASRLFQRIRDSQGIGYSVGALWQASLSDPLIAYLQWEARPGSVLGVSPQSTARITAPIQNPNAPTHAQRAPAPETQNPLSPDTALRLLATQLDGLLSDPPSEAEVQRARSVAIGQESLRHERAKDRAFLLAWYEAMGVGAEFDTALPRRLAAVTRDDVLRVARAYLKPRASVLIVPGP